MSKYKPATSIIVFFLSMILVSCSFVNLYCEPIEPNLAKCSIFKTEEEIKITLEEAISIGFPIFLPSDEVFERNGIDPKPTVEFKAFNKDCSYLDISFFYKINLNEQALKIEISNGCGLDFWRGYKKDFTWASEGTVWILSEHENSSVVFFDEPTQNYRYLVFSEDNLRTTMEIIETIPQYLD